MPAVRMKDIAKAVNVSRPTVSVVLNKRDTVIHISKKTRDKVLAAAERLGYRPNELARSMVTGKSNFIGFIAADIIYEYTARILSGIIERANQSQFFIKIFSYKEQRFIKSSIDSILAQRPAAIISRSLSKGTLEYLHIECMKLEIPLAILDSGTGYSWGIRVNSNNVNGMEISVNHLIDLGHKKIGFLGNERGLQYIEERYQGYCNAMKNANLEIIKTHTICDKIKNIEALILKLFSTSDTPSAFVCASDLNAMLLLRTIRKLGLNVPKDISVIGYANFEMATVADPALTSVAEGFEKVGETAVDEVLKELKLKQPRFSKSKLSRTIDVKLIVRDSTARVKSSKK